MSNESSSIRENETYADWQARLARERADEAEFNKRQGSVRARRTRVRNLEKKKWWERNTVRTPK